VQGPFATTSVLALAAFVGVVAFAFAIGLSPGPGEYGPPRRLPSRSRISLAIADPIVIFRCAKINQFTMPGFHGVLTGSWTSTARLMTVAPGPASPVTASGGLTGWAVEVVTGPRRIDGASPPIHDQGRRPAEGTGGELDGLRWTAPVSANRRARTDSSSSATRIRARPLVMSR
jgi:hypothetical protein